MYCISLLAKVYSMGSGKEPFIIQIVMYVHCLHLNKSK